MKIESAEIRIIQLQLLKPFQTSFGIEFDRKMMLVTLKGEGLEGFAEGVMMAQPLYLEETVSGALTVLKEAIFPRVLGCEISNPQGMNDLLSPIRGNNMAKAAIEMAFLGPVGQRSERSPSATCWAAAGAPFPSAPAWAYKNPLKPPWKKLKNTSLRGTNG